MHNDDVKWRITAGGKFEFSNPVVVPVVGHTQTGGQTIPVPMNLQFYTMGSQILIDIDGFDLITAGQTGPLVFAAGQIPAQFLPKNNILLRACLVINEGGYFTQLFWLKPTGEIDLLYMDASDHFATMQLGTGVRYRLIPFVNTYSRV
jgi:hypothetical protein